jgi:hypothetical protein
MFVAIKELVLLKQFCISRLVIFIGCSYFLNEGLTCAVIQIGKEVLPEPEGSLPSLQQHTIKVYLEPTGQFTFLSSIPKILLNIIQICYPLHCT